MKNHIDQLEDEKQNLNYLEKRAINIPNESNRLKVTRSKEAIEAIENTIEGVRNALVVNGD